MSPASPAPSTTRPVPGVIADCIRAPHQLSIRPAGITLACAGNGLGVENMARDKRDGLGHREGHVLEEALQAQLRGRPDRHLRGSGYALGGEDLAAGSVVQPSEGHLGGGPAARPDTWQLPDAAAGQLTD
jgi:hypothetical protein